jgi:F-type H+-transporting ATPase subunit gamma
MKMVAAAKLKHDERRMHLSFPFIKPAQDLLGRLPREDKPGPILFLAVTSDKGLCGGVNTQVAKWTRLGVQEEEAKGNSAKIMVMGGKGTAALKRNFGDRFSTSFEELAKIGWTFTTACVVAEHLIAASAQRLTVVSNLFKSLVAYETTPKQTVTYHEAQTMDRAEWSKAMDVYSFEPSIYEVWEDLHEFYYATVIHGVVLEGATCEQSSRMSAMENASKNAGEMLEKISLIYNRARQAKITTELCEIISGASAV